MKLGRKLWKNATNEAKVIHTYLNFGNCFDKIGIEQKTNIAWKEGKAKFQVKWLAFSNTGKTETIPNWNGLGLWIIVFSMKPINAEIPKVNHNGRIHFLLCSFHKNKLVKKKKIITEELINVKPRKKSFKAEFLRKETPWTISESK